MFLCAHTQTCFNDLQKTERQTGLLPKLTKKPLQGMMEKSLLGKLPVPSYNKKIYLLKPLLKS